MRADDGSALMLMPACVLVMIVLAAIAVDAAVMFLGERELAAATAAAANDAAVAALDEASFYDCGALVVSDHAARRVAAQSIAARSSDAVTITSLDVAVSRDDDPIVTVTAMGTVELVFSPAVPGGRGQSVVEATSVARAQAAGPASAALAAAC